MRSPSRITCSWGISLSTCSVMSKVSWTSWGWRMMCSSNTPLMKTTAFELLPKLEELIIPFTIRPKDPGFGGTCFPGREVNLDNVFAGQSNVRRAHLAHHFQAARFGVFGRRDVAAGSDPNHWTRKCYLRARNNLSPM